MLENLLKYVPVPKREDIKITDKDVKEFLDCVLSEVPYRKEYRVGKIVISFVSPKINVFEKEVNLDELFVACIDKIVTDKGIHEFGATNRPSEERARIVETILFSNNSPLGYIAVQKFIEFLYQFQALLQELLSPRFFGTDSTKQ